MAQWSRRNSNQLLVLASKTVIREHEQRYEEPPSGLYFNKHLSLLHRTLQAEGVDLQLPHCWYRFGDEVVRQWMPSPVYWNHENPNYTTVSWKDDFDTRGIDDSVEAQVTTQVKRLAVEYEGNDGLRRAIDDVYSYAPFDFQREFRNLRLLFAEAEESEIGVENMGEYLSSRVESAFDTFPHNEFAGLSSRANHVSKAVQMLLQESSQELQLASEMAMKFWELYCYHLRLHPAGHENVPESTLELWSEELQPQAQKFDLVFGAHLAQATEIVPSIKEDEDLGPLIRRLEAGDEELEELLEEMGPILDELGDFLSGLKSGYTPN